MSSVLLVQVKRTYSNGTYRAGAMRQISLVGAVDEEVGDYFPEFLGMLEESPFLKVRLHSCGGPSLLAFFFFFKINGVFCVSKFLRQTLQSASSLEIPPTEQMESASRVKDSRSRRDGWHTKSV